MANVVIGVYDTNAESRKDRQRMRKDRKNSAPARTPACRNATSSCSHEVIRRRVLCVYFPLRPLREKNLIGKKIRFAKLSYTL
jgi:hypothetical protein